MSELIRQKLSDSESLEISNAMVMAAMEALGERVEASEMDSSKTAKLVILAIRAASKAGAQGVKRFEELYPGTWISWDYTEAVDAAASAFWWWCLDIDLLDEPPVAGCYGATPFLAFAQAMMATTFADLAEDAIDDPDAAFVRVENGSREKLWNWMR